MPQADLRRTACPKMLFRFLAGDDSLQLRKEVAGWLDEAGAGAVADEGFPKKQDRRRSCYERLTVNLPPWPYAFSNASRSCRAFGLISGSAVSARSACGHEPAWHVLIVGIPGNGIYAVHHVHGPAQANPDVCGDAGWFLFAFCSPSCF